MTISRPGKGPALRGYLALSRVLPLLAPAEVAPFVPLLMAHACAAMTHLSGAVR